MYYSVNVPVIILENISKHLTKKPGDFLALAILLLPYLWFLPAKDKRVNLGGIFNLIGLRFFDWYLGSACRVKMYTTAYCCNQISQKRVIIIDLHSLLISNWFLQRECRLICLNESSIRKIRIHFSWIAIAIHNL